MPDLDFSPATAGPEPGPDSPDGGEKMSGLIDDRWNENEFGLALHRAETTLPESMKVMLRSAYARHACLALERAGHQIPKPIIDAINRIENPAPLSEGYDDPATEMLRRSVDGAYTLSAAAASTADAVRFAQMEADRDGDPAYNAEREWQRATLITALACRDLDCLPINFDA